MKQEALHRLNFLIRAPFDVDKEDIHRLHEALQEFPYFQPLRMLYLKGLNKIESPEYEQALKQAAIYSADRSLLFNYITKEHVNETGKVSEKQEEDRPDRATYRSMIDHEPDSFPLSESDLKFSTNDQRTFSDWLKLSKIRPVEKASISSKHDREGKFKAIEQFLRNYRGPNPSKNIVESAHSNRYNVVENENLMTETLAQIYVQQKKYNKAVKAYKILSLKYPEKSGSFADRIRAIKNEIQNQ